MFLRVRIIGPREPVRPRRLSIFDPFYLRQRGCTLCAGPVQYGRRVTILYVIYDNIHCTYTRLGGLRKTRIKIMIITYIYLYNILIMFINDNDNDNNTTAEVEKFHPRAADRQK